MTGLYRCLRDSDWPNVRADVAAAAAGGSNFYRETMHDEVSVILMKCKKLI